MGTKNNVKIADLLAPGRGNAKKAQELSALTGMSERTVREVILKERRAGAPILSDNANGYFLMGDPSETRHFIRSMRHRAGEILKSAAAVERATGLH